MTNKDKKALKTLLEAGAYTKVFSAYPDVAAHVAASHKGNIYNAVGWATCGPKDKWNEALGLQIAIGQALDKIIRKIVRQREKQDAT